MAQVDGYGKAVRATADEVKIFEKVMSKIPLTPQRYTDGKKVGGSDKVHLNIDLNRDGKKNDMMICIDNYSSKADRRFGCAGAYNIDPKRPADIQSFEFEIKGIDILGDKRLGKMYIGDIDLDGDIDVAVRAKDGAVYVFHSLLVR